MSVMYNRGRDISGEGTQFNTDLTRFARNGVSMTRGKRVRKEGMQAGNRLELTSMFGRHFASNIAIAAKLPDPIVTYGSLSVDPCG